MSKKKQIRVAPGQLWRDSGDGELLLVIARDRLTRFELWYCWSVWPHGLGVLSSPAPFRTTTQRGTGQLNECYQLVSNVPRGKRSEEV